MVFEFAEWKINVSLQARETARDSLKASVALKKRGINEEEFFGFGRSYLSEVFPYPQRDVLRIPTG